jgi:hypothetical protein
MPNEIQKTGGNDLVKQSTNAIVGKVQGQRRFTIEEVLDATYQAHEIQKQNPNSEIGQMAETAVFAMLQNSDADPAIRHLSPKVRQLAELIEQQRQEGQMQQVPDAQEQVPDAQEQVPDAQEHQNDLDDEDMPF